MKTNKYSRWASVDIGAKGAISIWQDHLLTEIIDMPMLKTKVKDAVYVYKHKNPKILIKTGPKKGQRAKVIKSPAKYKNELDINKINEIIIKMDIDFMVIEDLGYSVGSSVSSVKTSAINLGMILGVAKLRLVETIMIRPHIWKKSLGLGKDKIDTIEYVEKDIRTKYQNSYRTKKGALLDGRADSAAIGLWYIKESQLTPK